MSDRDKPQRLDDPLAGSPWSQPSTVAGFLRSGPNETLIRAASTEHGALANAAPQRRLLDIGCGAGRNAVPLASLGWRVFGVDLSAAMLNAARSRPTSEPDALQRVPLHLALARMDALPFVPGTFDFIVAHGIWNLATSGAEFRRAVADAARLLRPGGALFLFTFSRATLDDTARPVAGETFVFTQFSGAPQCFLTAEQIVAELADAGFDADPEVPLRELNRRRPGELTTRQGPVIYEGLFRLRDA